MGFVKTCTKCGKTKPIDDFYNSPTGKYGVCSVCKECMRKECKKHYPANLEKKRAMYKLYRERHAKKIKEEQKKAEMIEILRASEILGGYRIYVLNHVKEGEAKYTCVKVATAEVYRTNDKRKFLSYLEERLVKTDKGTFYWRTQLEVYQAHGWLNFGHSTWSDRKKAAEILATSHHIGFGEPIGALDMSRPFVDGHGTHYVSEVAYFNQQCYQQAMKSIRDRLIKAIIRVVLIEDKSVLYPNSGQNRRLRKKNEMRRRLLCEGLDILVKHYMPEVKKKGITGFSKVRII